MTWAGKTVAVCGSGPSLTVEVAARVRSLGVPVIVTNDTWQRLPDADVLFAANAAWWHKLAPTVEEFHGERICSQPGVTGTTYVPPRRVAIGGNSALRACHLAQDRGAARILLFGVDLRPDELTHWHGLHRGLDNPNWTTFKRHRTAWEQYAREPGRPEIVNCNPRSALQCYPMEADQPSTILVGMHGLGDNLHERAIVRELMKHGEVWLKTSWPQLYWDMAPPLHLLPLGSPIPWMAKNELRCADLYDTARPPAGARIVRCGYHWPYAQESSVLAAMARQCHVDVGDFRLPIAPAWRRRAGALIASMRPDRPLLITRPLLAIDGRRRPRSARAKLARNPDPAAYAALYALLRKRYFVVSIADTQPGVEWAIEPYPPADVEFHRGELDIETLAALVERAALVYCSPCFLTVLAQAVQTPQICVFGGFEGANSFEAGARFSRWLPIEPVRACRCWDCGCRHDKTIDLDAASAAIEQFIGENDVRFADTQNTRQPAAIAGAHANA